MSNTAVRGFARAALLGAVALLLISAAPSNQFIALTSDPGEGLIIPADSPVQFQQFGEYNRARFSGRFLVEGVFVLDCNYCEPGSKDNELSLSIIPDASVATRLPHWKIHNNDIAIDITKASPFIRAVSTPDERRRLLSGRLDEIKGRAALIIDHFEAGLDCDSANYSARFVAIARAPKIARADLKGNYGCA